MQADLEDVNFLRGMESLLNMKADEVEKLIDTMDADQLTTLADAVANNNKDQLQQIIDSIHSDEDVNPLFRGENINAGKRIKKHRRKVADNYGFKFGDDVQVRVFDPDTKQYSWQDGTIHIPDGPDDTVGVKIEGKARMVERGKVRPLTENMGVTGMVSMPNLERMQQLAGIPQGSTTEIAASGQETIDPTCAAEQAMAALETVEMVLPNIRLADLKVIRQRILDLQTAMSAT
jgi:hypothetical protein